MTSEMGTRFFVQGMKCNGCIARARKALGAFIRMLPLLFVASAATADETVSARGIRVDSLVLGGQLFQKYCAECHGSRAQGAENWKQRGVDGKFPPPPLDATGHAWHHPRSALVRTIRDGTAAIGGNMPAWRGRLSEAEINSIVDWIVSGWPEPAFEAWRRGGHH